MSMEIAGPPGETVQQVCMAAREGGYEEISDLLGNSLRDIDYEGWSSSEHSPEDKQLRGLHFGWIDDNSPQLKYGRLLVVDINDPLDSSPNRIRHDVSLMNGLPTAFGTDRLDFIPSQLLYSVGLTLARNVGQRVVACACLCRSGSEYFFDIRYPRVYRQLFEVMKPLIKQETAEVAAMGLVADFPDKVETFNPGYSPSLVLALRFLTAYPSPNPVP